MNSFFVPGQPVPQGSLKFINGRAIHARAVDLATWRADIARAAEGTTKHEGPVSVGLTFTMKRGKTVKRQWPHVRPDLDKLIRAVLDGLTGVAYNDDEQVCCISALKEYGDKQGVYIWIEPITDEER
jgi:crossover junction endodeoxyribonuclease RusA